MIVAEVFLFFYHCVERMKEPGTRVPCLHFRDKLLQLSHYAKSGRVDPDFVVCFVVLVCVGVDLGFGLGLGLGIGLGLGLGLSFSL